MESNMVSSFSSSNNSIVTDFFSKNLPEFTFLSQTSHGPYWGVRFSNNDIEVNVSGDIGFSIEVIIAGTKFELWQYDRKVIDKMKTTNENILYQLNVLKSFLKETL